MGLSNKIGTVEKDKYADLILVAGNPLHNVMDLAPKTNIRLVMKGGRVIINRDVSLSTTSS
jgi:imidazolonepropionase-like amidohydrolase